MQCVKANEDVVEARQANCIILKQSKCSLSNVDKAKNVGLVNKYLTVNSISSVRQD